VGDLIGLEIDLDRRPSSVDPNHVNAARQPGPVQAVVGRIGKGAIDAHFLGQLEFQIWQIAEGRRAIRLQRNGDDVKVASGAAASCTGSPLLLPSSENAATLPAKLTGCPALSR